MASEAEPAGSRIPLVLVAGLHDDQVRATAAAVHAQDPAGTALVHHDLRGINDGVVRRTIRHRDQEQHTTLELAHGCVSCTLREDLLPLLRRLSSAPEVDSVVVRLDPAIEPEAICWALANVPVGDRTVDEDVDLRAVITVVDEPTWLADAGGDEALAERGIGGSADDERTLAQVVVSQVEFADAVVLAGAAPDRWTSARSEAVLARLTPEAPTERIDALDPSSLLDRVPATARRGEVDGPHGRLLRGQPPMQDEVGVMVMLFEERRPFHPQRLHDALDVLLEGTLRTRGRAWVASQPDSVLWLESAGGGLAIGHAGPWLAALPEQQWSQVEPDRQLRASLHWDEDHGDRMQELVVIAHSAEPGEIRHALNEALLTDDELSAGRAAWAQYPDPFAEWHEEPCADAIEREAERRQP